MADRAFRTFSSEHQHNTAVLVGEVKRGKSALANALVDQRDASPAGIAVATAVPVVLGPTGSDLEAGSALITTNGEKRIVPASELAQWVAPNGANASTVSRAYIAVQDSAMGSTRVVDTPGVGGLAHEAARISADSARSASVIVVVADATAPLTAPEMTFISQAVDRTESVIVAVTKIDKNLTRWREIVGENRRLLAQHIGRHIPVVGVSSLLPHLGSDFISEVSGINQLRDLINARFAKAENIPAANGLRVAVEGLREMERALDSEASSIRESSLFLPGLNTDLERLENLQLDVEEWREYLQWDISQAKLQSLHQLDTTLMQLEEEWKIKISSSGLRALRQEPKEHTRLMAEDFQNAATAALERFSLTLKDDVIASRFESPNERRAVMESIEERLIEQSLKTDDDIVTRHKPVDHTLVGDGISEGIGIGGALAGMLAMAGVGAIAGLGWTVASLGLSALNQGKDALLEWLRQTRLTTFDYVRRSLDEVELSARPAITIAYQATLKRQIADTKRRIAEAEKARALDQERRERVVASLEQRRTEVQKLAAELEQHIANLMEKVR